MHKMNTLQQTSTDTLKVRGSCEETVSERGRTMLDGPTL